MEPILDNKFKAPYVKMKKFDNFRKIRALGPSFPDRPNTPNTKYPETSMIQPTNSLKDTINPSQMFTFTNVIHCHRLPL